MLQKVIESESVHSKSSANNMLDSRFPENSSDAQKLFFRENNGNHDESKAVEEFEVLESFLLLRLLI